MMLFLNGMNNTIEFLKEVKAELKNVTWPSREKTMYSTIAVLIVSVGVAYYLGFFDYIFSLGLERILTK